MVFLTGPRQVGKTTFSQELLKEAFPASWERGYFNWDIPEVQKSVLTDPTHFWNPSDRPPLPRIVLDEIHKYPRWKRFLKGFADANRTRVETIVTGSGRLDVYQKGGDSLFGRYHLYHLMPLSVGELTGSMESPEERGPDAFLERQTEAMAAPGSREAFEALWHRNGFPEPFYAGDERSLVRWQHDHRQLIVRQDLRDLTMIREIGLIEQMIALLPERVGAPLSLNAIREDLNVNYRTVQNWVRALSRLYFLFAIRPYSRNVARALRREEKLYFFDWSVLEDPGKRFENLVAVHLLKSCHYWTEAGFGDFELCYVRDKEKREVDFLVTRDRKPFLLVEAKLSDRALSPSLVYFHKMLRPDGTVQVILGPFPPAQKREEDIWLTPAHQFLSGLV